MDSRHHWVKKATWAVAVLILSGCATTRPAEFYTLSPLSQSRAPLGSEQGCRDIEIGVGPVNWPKFLKRPQIVTRTSDNRLTISEFHRWGGSLQEDFSRVVAQNLSLLLDTQNVALYPRQGGRPITYRIEVDIHEFEGRLGNSVHLNAAWTLKDHDSNGVLAARRSVIKEPASSNDYESLVAAQSAAVATLSKRIADEITAQCTQSQAEAR